MTVTKQQQLEFAAKHIEKWKSGYDYAVVEETTDRHLYVRWPSICTSGITKKDWQQERDKMQKQAAQPAQDNSWHERGELPPVGVWCEALCDDALPEECKILAYHQDQVAVQWKEFNGGCLDVIELPGDYWKFHPLCTEREKAIDEMANLIATSVFGSAKCQAEKLYDAGYRKVNP